MTKINTTFVRDYNSLKPIIDQSHNAPYRERDVSSEDTIYRELLVSDNSKLSENEEPYNGILLKWREGSSSSTTVKIPYANVNGPSYIMEVHV